jgi:hypothetical protein
MRSEMDSALRSAFVQKIISSISFAMISAVDVWDRGSRCSVILNLFLKAFLLEYLEL